MAPPTKAPVLVPAFVLVLVAKTDENDGAVGVDACVDRIYL